MIDKQIAREWVEALRSGKYEQGTGNLRVDDKFCCLGVLCDLHAQAYDYNWSNNNEYYLGSNDYLPEEVREWIGFTLNMPAVKVPADSGRIHALSDLNDGSIYHSTERTYKKYTFTEIADLIESQWIK